MAESPRDWKGAMEYAQQQTASRSRDWTGLCQMFVRSSYGLPGGFGSAIAQWYGADEEDRHVGGNPADAPVGSALCFKSSPYGHIMLAARPFESGNAAAWGTDMVRVGHVDKHARTAPTTAWNQPYLGYLTSINGYDLRIKEDKPPVPKQDKPYEGIRRAIENLKAARETARNQKDQHDVEVLTKEIQRLKRKYDNLRRY